MKTPIKANLLFNKIKIPAVKENNEIIKVKKKSNDLIKYTSFITSKIFGIIKIAPKYIQKEPIKILSFIFSELPFMSQS